MRLIVRVLLVSTLLVPLVHPGMAAAAAADGYGLGVYSCGEMLSKIESSPAKDVSLKPNALSFLSWMQGYLSARNVWGPPPTLKLVDFDAHWRWLLNWCEEHPLELMANGVYELAIELKR